jgi:hypothetical protein
MTDDTIETIALAAAVLALAAAAAVLVRAWLASKRKRRALVAAYTRPGPKALDEIDRRLGLDPNRFAPRVWPRPPLQPPGDGGPFKRRPEPEPLRPAYSSRSSDEGYTPPSFPADPSPVVFGEPVSLSSPSFEVEGGSFGGGGASGGWDAPSSGDSGGSCDSGSSGGDSGGGCSND